MMKTKCCWPFLLLFLFVGIGILFHRLGFWVNTTDSMPMGFYRTLQGLLHRGDIVLLCLPPRETAFGLQRHYLKSGFACGTSEPLLKHVIAVPGDTVIVSQNEIQVNGVTWFAPTRSRDQEGRSLPHIPRGIYLRTANYWLLGTGNILHSWDSRYWGGVTDKAIRFHVIRIEG